MLKLINHNFNVCTYIYNMYNTKLYKYKIILNILITDIGFITAME